jgi:hypothetical protein
MTKIDKILKKLSELYEFNRKIKAYHLKKKASKSLKEDTGKNRRAP